MRVLIVTNRSVITGGADRHCFDLAEILERDGHQVTFLATETPGRVIDGAFVPLLVSNRTRDALAGAERARVAQRAVWNRQAAGAMEELIDRFAPDVVHVHKSYPHLSVSPVVVAARRGVPIVQTVHDYEFVSASPWSTGGERIDRNETRSSYRVLNSVLFQVKRNVHAPRVDRWIAVSRSVGDTLRGAGIEAEVLPNFTMFPVRSAPREDRGGVVFAGQLIETKGIREVIDLAREMSDLEVAVAGHGPLGDEVERAARSLPNLKPLGLLDTETLRSRIESSLVCVMPSRWAEPGPLACLESMASGTPVVAYDAGGLGEYVRDSGAGTVVPDGTPLAGPVRELIEDGGRWGEISDRALVAASTVHSPELYLERLLAIYRSLT